MKPAHIKIYIFALNCFKHRKNLQIYSYCFKKLNDKKKSDTMECRFVLLTDIIKTIANLKHINLHK